MKFGVQQLQTSRTLNRREPRSGDRRRSMARLQQPRQLRLGLSIDDFGTGYSSLAYLKSFPINVLKIDRSFVTDIDQDEENRAITRAIVAMSDAPGARRCG